MRTITINTRVTDEFGSPVANAHLSIPNGNGATTNSNGYASLTGNAYDLLTISHVGKTSAQFTLQETPRLVELKERYENLDEVVITAKNKPIITDPSLPKYFIPAIGGLALLMILMSASSSSKPEKVTL